MIGYARQFPAHQLARLGHRILEHVAPEIAERADREALRREERRAHRARYLSFTPTATTRSVSTAVSGSRPRRSSGRRSTRSATPDRDHAIAAADAPQGSPTPPP